MSIGYDHTYNNMKKWILYFQTSEFTMLQTKVKANWEIIKIQVNTEGQGQKTWTQLYI